MISIPENHPEKVAILRLLVLYDARYSGDRIIHATRIKCSPELRCSTRVAPDLISRPCFYFPDALPTAREGSDDFLW